ncbi:hypothetical protein [Flavobacterium sp. 3HN19-14]|uniref:hypothetical protein n=1 Tax=Flavobacterium sp. 3HN19-14 TaxID=3448133 RepID=UPI003EE18D40
MLPLFNNEKIVSQSANGAVTLTTDRICYQYEQDGETQHRAIMLEQVTSCKNNFSSSISLLALAGISFVVGMLGMLTHVNSLYAMLLVSVLLLAIYVPSRRNVMVIASAEGEMEVPASDIEAEYIEEFLNKVEVVKYERIINLNEIEVIF